MNGAESLVKTLLKLDINVCFANPGTSEMHFVAALDKVPGIRCILGLFEGVVTGAADGYFRIAKKPAITLLHLGPGLANGLANLHNAKKAGSGIVNIVGEHALGHIALDAPLTADIEGIASPMSHWIETPKTPQQLGPMVASAVAVSSGVPPQISTLILPADVAWSEGGVEGERQTKSDYEPIDEESISNAAEALKNGEKTLILLGGNALTEDCLLHVSKILSGTKCLALTEWSNTRLDRGVGLLELNRIPYVVEKALAVLENFTTIILVGAKEPVAFFAYPNKPGKLANPRCKFVQLSNNKQNAELALRLLSKKANVQNSKINIINERYRPPIPYGPITSDGIACVLGSFIPDSAIVVDESVTTGREFFSRTSRANRHVWLNNRGGSIGYGLPVALGAAIAAPDQKVIALESDGSGMYTCQALWSIAREKLDVTVLIFSNRSYKILHGELKNVGVSKPGPRASEMFSLENPNLDWVFMANGMGVDAIKVQDMLSLKKAFQYAMNQSLPYLIEVEME